jgi:hypothetical protein
MSPWAELLVTDILTIAPGLTREELVRAARRRVVREERACRAGEPYVNDSTFDGALIRMRNRALANLSVESEL